MRSGGLVSRGQVLVAPTHPPTRTHSLANQLFDQPSDQLTPQPPTHQPPQAVQPGTRQAHTLARPPATGTEDDQAGAVRKWCVGEGEGAAAEPTALSMGGSRGGGRGLPDEAAGGPPGSAADEDVGASAAAGGEVRKGRLPDSSCWRERYWGGAEGGRGGERGGGERGQVGRGRTE